MSQHSNYLHKWLVHLNLTCLLLPCLFFSVRFLNMCQPRTTFYLFWWAGPSGLSFYGSGPACLLSWLEMVNAGWLLLCYQKLPYKWNLSFFKAVPRNRLLFCLGSLLHIISSSFSRFCLFENAILHKMSKLGFWRFKPMFSRNAVFIGCSILFSSFSHLFELIYAS